MTAQFSNGKKVYFGTNEVRDKVYPNMSDGAAYGPWSSRLARTSKS
jgi:hypothetical protein